MTSIDKIRSMSDAVITPEVASKALGCKPHFLRVAAQQRPEMLGFPVNVMGTRVRIPRIPFLKFLGVDADG